MGIALYIYRIVVVLVPPSILMHFHRYINSLAHCRKDVVRMSYSLAFAILLFYVNLGKTIPFIPPFTHSRIYSLESLMDPLDGIHYVELCSTFAWFGFGFKNTG